MDRVEPTGRKININILGNKTDCFKKEAEDGEGYVIRAYERAGKAVSCEIDCKKLGVYTVDFTPYEAKTEKSCFQYGHGCFIFEI